MELANVPDEMVQAVKAVFPESKEEEVLADLRLTNSAENTINRMLEGQVFFFFFFLLLLLLLSFLFCGSS